MMNRILGRPLRWSILGAQALAVTMAAYHTAVTASGTLLPARRRRPSRESEPRFGLIVCAHNEEAVIADLVRDLTGQDYPRHLFRCLVVAHNCRDATAEVARAAGAEVVELSTPVGGKTAALERGLEWYGESVDIVGVLDADARLAPGTLTAVAEQIGDSWALQLEGLSTAGGGGLAGGQGLARRARSLMLWRPRSRLGLSVVLNGGAFFLRRPAAAFTAGLQTMAEDLELTARIIARGGRVGYLEGTFLRVDEPLTLDDTVSQRLRWARGHLGVIRHEGPALAAAAMRGNVAAADLLAYLLVPTRLLTRVFLTGMVLLSWLTRVPALPSRILWPAALSEWAFPAAIAVRGGLVQARPSALLLLARVALLSFLWFPIGLGALWTVTARTWVPVGRASRDRDGEEERER